MTPRRKTTFAWIAAALLVIAGSVAVAIGLMTPVSFGWFAHQPLSSATFAGDGSGFFVSRTTVVGSVVLMLGLAGVAFLFGAHVGARRGSVAKPPRI